MTTEDYIIEHGNEYKKSNGFTFPFISSLKSFIEKYELLKINDEKILCASIWYKDLPLERIIPDNCNPINVDRGVCFSAFRHSHCMYTMTSVTGKPTNDNIGEHVQGFLTSKNRFVDRKEALIIALKMNQVKDINDIRGDNLYSEDLY